MSEQPLPLLQVELATIPDPLAQLAVTCPHLARNLALLPPEQLQTILTEKDAKR